MALIDTSSVNQLASTLKSAADQARSIAGGTGPLLISQIVTMQSTFQRACALRVKVAEAVSSNETVAMGIVEANGGPSTVEDFSAQGDAIEVAAANWGSDLSAQFLSAGSAVSYTVGPVTNQGSVTRMVIPPTELPETESNILRAATSLSDLITALEASGA